MSKPTKPTTEDRQAAARARAEAARQFAAATDAVLQLDVTDIAAHIAECDRQAATARRTAARAEHDLQRATAAKAAAITSIRRAITTTGAAPKQASDLLGIPESWCRPLTETETEPDTDTHTGAEPEPETEPEGIHDDGS
ncbi:MAG: hypothetical protein ACYCTL_12735 [Acidimicrobiales bacterium]